MIDSIMSKRNKIFTLGVLGGLGPETTAMFYLNVINKATVKRRPAICIWSAPLNIKKEAAYIASGANKPYYLEILKKGIKTLEDAGSNVIVIACNTVHEFYNELQALTNVPIVNLIDEVAHKVKSKHWEEALIFATSNIIQNKLYQKALEKVEVRSTVPSKKDQKRIDKLILKILHANVHTQADIDIIGNIIEKYQCHYIVLACTDLFKFFPNRANVIDSTDVLVERSSQILLRQKL
ncbi:MAG: amino acid racemase [bacterium]